MQYEDHIIEDKEKQSSSQPVQDVDVVMQHEDHIIVGSDVDFRLREFLYILIQFEVNEPIDFSKVLEHLGRPFDQHPSLVSLHSCF